MIKFLYVLGIATTVSLPTYAFTVDNLPLPPTGQPQLHDLQVGRYQVILTTPHELCAFDAKTTGNEVIARGLINGNSGLLQIFVKVQDPGQVTFQPYGQGMCYLNVITEPVPS